MTPQTVARLAELDEIVAIKEATGSMDQASEIASLCDIVMLSGDDSLTLPLMSLGGRGVISVVGNIVPKDVKVLTEAALKGNFETALKQHLKLFPLFKAMFIETNPIPVKTAMGMLGLCSDTLRLPMYRMAPANKKKLREAMLKYGLKV
jgi:4-hydroxy-tetrahydrodipicolinate synthase